jgi:hypothetical protein
VAEAGRYARYSLDSTVIDVDDEPEDDNDS